MRLVRTALSIVAAAATAWLCGSVLGEYVFEGLVPVVGGAMLGLAVAAAASLPWMRHGAPWWGGLPVSVSAGLGEALAVDIDTADLRPWPWEGYLAVVLAAGAALAWWLARVSVKGETTGREGR